MYWKFEAHQHKIFLCEGQGKQKIDGGLLLYHIPHAGIFFMKPLQGSIYELFRNIIMGYNRVDLL